MTSTDSTITAAFRAAFQSHPERSTDSALALESARETAAALVPAGITGTFDDEALTFTADGTSTSTTTLTCRDCGRTIETGTLCDDCDPRTDSWVVIADLGDDGTWITQEQAYRVEELMAEDGWDLDIREPRRGEAEGTYTVNRDGTLQIMGYSIPVPEEFERALAHAADRVIG